MDWAVARVAGFDREAGAGPGVGAGGEDSTVVLPVFFFFLTAFPRRAAGAGGGSANSSSWGRLTRWPAFAPARDRAAPRGCARVPVADLFRVPARAFTFPFTVSLRDAFAKGPFLLANSAV
jgi:hypothetical protein